MDIIDCTIAREGSFVLHPEDPGGATKYGITRRTLGWWLGRTASVEDVRGLKYATAYAIYHARYMRKPGFDLIQNAWLRELVFDAGVLNGTWRATRWLQDSSGAAVDGIIGPKTLAAVNSGNPHQIGQIIIVCWLRRNTMRVQEGKSSPAFVGGWAYRATQHLIEMPEEAFV